MSPYKLSSDESLDSICPRAGFSMQDSDADQFVSVVMIDEAPVHFAVGRPLRFSQADIQHIRFIVVIDPNRGQNMISAG